MNEAKSWFIVKGASEQGRAVEVFKDAGINVTTSGKSILVLLLEAMNSGKSTLGRR